MGGGPACSELCQLTGTGIMTWGKWLSFLSVIGGEDVNLPSLCVFLYLVYFHWYSQLHSYSQLSVFLVRIGTDFWLMVYYIFQAKYQKVCPLISSLTVFRTLTGCVQKYALQTADIASCLELLTAYRTNIWHFICQYEIIPEFQGPCYHDPLKCLSPMHPASPSWQGVLKILAQNARISSNL